MWLKFLVGLILGLCVFLFNINDEPASLGDKSLSMATRKVDALMPPNVEVPQPPSASILHVFEKAAVCSDKKLCSHIGSVIFQRGGNVIDSAIATLLCNGLVTMQSMGIGGGVIMTYYQRKSGKVVAIMGRERAPLDINFKSIMKLQNATTLAKSGLSIAVPGEVAAYYEAHHRYGKLSWNFLIKPTVDLCYRGYQLTRHQRDSLFLNEPMIRTDKLLSQMFVDPKTNLFYREGWNIKIPTELCNTYELLMNEGPLTFYNGSLSNLILQDLHDMGSVIKAQDLLSYKVEMKDAFVVDLDPYYLYLPPPPASGHVLGYIMEILKEFKEKFYQIKDLSALEIHRIVEALKFGFVKRWQVDVETDFETLKKMLVPKHIKRIRNLIDDLKTFDNAEHYDRSVRFKQLTDHGTAQISVLAPNGDAVAITSSINFYFGTGRMGSRTGIVFNNAISDFTIPNFENYFNLPNIDDVNYIKPQKQAMSSMVPLIVTNKETGDVRLVVGAAGGTRIISALTQILIRVLWLKQNIKEAIDAPRFHHQLLPNVLEYEFGLLQQVVENLEKRGHKTKRVRRKSTAVCGLEKTKEGLILGNADYRKEGAVDGF